MSAETLSKIYHDAKDPSPLGGVQRLLLCARQLCVLGVMRKTFKKYLHYEQAYIRYTSRRAVGSPVTSYIWRGSMLSGRSTWLICRVSQGRTIKLGFFLPWLRYFPNLHRRFRFTLRMPKEITVAIDQVLTVAHPRHH